MTYRNLVELHRRQADRLGRRTALRYRRRGLWHDVTWDDYRSQVEAVAQALIQEGIEPGARVGLLSENRVEWLIADLAILAAGAVNVPLHAPLTPRQLHFQLADSGTSWLFVSSQAQLHKVLDIRADLPDLRGIIVFDATSSGADVVPWRAFLHRGRSSPRTELERRETALDACSLATIVYTSGTTGNPKGVMLTHGNLLSNALGCEAACSRSPESILLSWLPYSHIYARTIDHYLSIAEGVTVCVVDSADLVVPSLAELRPTHVTAVPRFYEKLLSAVAAAASEQQKRQLRAIFGDRLQWCISGGAPLARAIADAYWAAGILILQGYGLTESSPVIATNCVSANKFGTVGQPLPGVAVRIASDGEILTSGPHVMQGYWNNPSATAEALRDGWLCTGDLGALDEDGYLGVTGRKKELLILSNGKKVVPTFIEGLLVAEPFIDQAVVFGEGRPFLTALIVPAWDRVRESLQRESLESDDLGPEALAGHAGVVALLRERVRRALVDVSPWEQVKQFAVLPQPFTVAAEELTVSLKLRREVIFEKYASTLHQLYAASLPQPVPVPAPFHRRPNSRGSAEGKKETGQT